MNAPRKIVRGYKRVEDQVGKSRVQIWRDIKAGLFPAPLELGPNSVGWYQDEIDGWLKSRTRRHYGAENSAEADLRFHRRVQRLHRLGDRVLGEFLAELGAERGITTIIDQKLERYAGLEPEALEATGGDRFWPAPLREV